MLGYQAQRSIIIMAKYKTKSILIGRKKQYKDNLDVRPCFISLFNENNPHKSGETPFEVLEFEKVHKVLIDGLKVHYLLPGNDILVNDLDYIEVAVKGNNVDISGKQFKK